MKKQKKLSKFELDQLEKKSKKTEMVSINPDDYQSIDDMYEYDYSDIETEVDNYWKDSENY